MVKIKINENVSHFKNMSYVKKTSATEITVRRGVLIKVFLSGTLII